MASPDLVARSEDKNMEHRPPFNFATIEPTNEVALRSFDEVCRYTRTRPRLSRDMHVMKNDLQQAHYQYDDEMSDFELDGDNQMWQAEHQGHWNLALLNDVSGKPKLKWTIGRGASNLGEDRGVTHLVSCPGKDPRGVAARHMELRIEEGTGTLILVALTDGRPIRIYPGDSEEVVEVVKGDEYRVQRMRTRLYLGDHGLTLAIRELTEQEFTTYVTLRDQAFEEAGFKVPDARLRALPMGPVLEQVGPYVLHKEIGCGARARVFSGIDTLAGKPCAIKRMDVDGPRFRNEIQNELDIYLSYRDQPGLMQASAICDGNGLSWRTGEHKAAEAYWMFKPFPYKVNVILPLCYDFHDWKWRFSPSLEEIVAAFRGILEGLCKLHSEGYMHRDITTKNCFILVRHPIQAVLGDPGKAIQALTDTCPYIGPAATMAPEVNGRTSYTNSIDIFSLGLAFAMILLPRIVHLPSYRPDRPQSSQWMMEMFQQVDFCARESALAGRVAWILHRMMAPSPAHRPSAASLLAEWPREHPLKERQEDSATAARIAQPSSLQKIDSVQTAHGSESLAPRKRLSDEISQPTEGIENTKKKRPMEDTTVASLDISSATTREVSKNEPQVLSPIAVEPHVKLEKKQYEDLVNKLAVENTQTSSDTGSSSSQSSMIEVPDQTPTGETTDAMVSDEEEKLDEYERGLFWDDD